jgi:hypothetical protein
MQLDFEWPKAVGYADDITCLTLNDQESKQAIFTEYEKFTKMSGLLLNADKTELYNFSNQKVAFGRNLSTRITYMGQNFEIQPLKEIKINGIILCQNLARQNSHNCAILSKKMDQHFHSWSQRNLSLLGKIQIYKTFGLSQFLYHLAVFEPDQRLWKGILDKVNKFLWNKSYANNSAPARVKKETLLTPIHKGGFGMIDLKEVVATLRLRRHFFLISHHIHPLSDLVKKLMEDCDYFTMEPVVGIDEVVQANMTVLYKKRLKDCAAPDWQLETDLLLHSNLLKCKVANLARPRTRQGNDINFLRRNQIYTLADAVREGGRPLASLLRIAQKEILPALRVIANIYRNLPQPALDISHKIQDRQGRWVEGANLTSKNLREILFFKDYAYPKILLMEDNVKARYFANLNKITSTCNKSRILRLLYRDVYCAERRVRFGLSDDDTCRRCFEKETIEHLLTDCAYSRAVYRLLQVDYSDRAEILGVDLVTGALEIRSDIICYLVFRQGNIPPEILVRTTLEKYAKGISYKKNVAKIAKRELIRIFGEDTQVLSLRSD